VGVLCFDFTSYVQNVNSGKKRERRGERRGNREDTMQIQNYIQYLFESIPLISRLQLRFLRLILCHHCSILFCLGILLVYLLDKVHQCRSLLSLEAPFDINCGGNAAL